MASPPIRITRLNMEQYLEGLAQSKTNAVSDPYTSGKHSLSESQIASSMRALGYSPTQIKDAETGNLPGRGSWIGNVLQGFAGGTAAMGPEISAPIGWIGDLLGGASDTADAASNLSSKRALSEYAPDEASAPKDNPEDGTKPQDTTNDPTSTNKLWNTGSNAAIMTIWGDLTADIKYAAVWVGLMVLGLILILSGLKQSGVTPPMPPMVIAP
jgi:hypothetical protein